MNPQSRRHHARRQRGAAALIVVMVLLFLVSLTAAYTNRNLIFEQRTSANQYRGTLAFEAADAGVEWSLAMLNGGVVGGACDDASPTKSFAQRYLLIAADGKVTHPVRNGNWPTCVFDGTDWSRCACPDDSPADPTPPTGSGVFPAFRVWLAAPGPATTPATPTSQLINRPGVVSIQSHGCTRLPTTSTDRCLDFDPQAELGDGLARVSAVLALKSGLPTPPTAAVTARLGVSVAAPAQLRVVNTHEPSGGLTVLSGGSVNGVVAQTLPGTPGEFSILASDSRLAALATTAPPTTPPAPPALSAGERMFVATFGVKRQTYREQPGLRVCASPCDAAAVNALLANNPDRVIWVEGDLTLDASVGTATEPALLVVNGTTLTLDPGVELHGFVYLVGDSTAAATATVALNSGMATIRGALGAEGTLQTTGTSSASELRVEYDADVLNVLRTRYGSWVRVGGSWRDYRNP
ncbi:MAG: pilus assembly PilX N-terminal domain-containing protein [Rubrivivax sp.]|nr:pilus assembly PilX N-terminal domain-containing protein [Rubrivivax sp.]